MKEIASTSLIGDRFLKMLVEGLAYSIHGGGIRPELAKIAIRTYFAILWGHLDQPQKTLEKVITLVFLMPSIFLDPREIGYCCSRR